MRPLRLAVSAFGPYASEQVIDFGVLGGRTFFLIHGPTGSGKTSILDAMSYALFGESSGGERGPDEVRSHHAAPEKPTEVTLDFAVGPQVYRVRRRPRQWRPARRGGGAPVRDDPSATLWRRSGPGDGAGEGSVLATKPGRVTETVERILGLGCEQFRQVILIPQGRFREFLIAGSRDRQEILQTLFGTARYRRIEAALKEAAHAIAADVQRVRDRQAQVLEEAGVERESDLADGRAQAEVECEAARGQRESAAHAQREAEDRRIEARRVADLLAERSLAQADLTRVESGIPTAQAWRLEIERARRAAALAPIEATLRERVREQAEAAAERSAAEEELARAQSDLQRGMADLARAQGSQAEQEALVAEVARLASLAQRVADLDAAREEARRRSLDADRLAADRDEVRRRLDVAREAAEASRRSCHEGALQAVGVEALDLALREAERAAAVGARLERLAQDRARAERAAAEASGRVTGTLEVLARAREALDGVETAWIAGQASLLSARLVDGEPCPVCGAREHPAPARGAEEVPGDSVVRRHRRAVQEASTRLDEERQAQLRAAEDLARIVSSVRTLEESLPPAPLPEAAERVRGVDEARRALLSARAAREAQPARQADLARREAEVESARGRLEPAETSLQESMAARDRARGVVEEREASVPQAVRAPGALEEARAAAVARLDRLRRDLEAAQGAHRAAAESRARAEARLAAARSTEDDAGRRRKTARFTLDQRLTAAGFDGEAGFVEARRSEAELDHREAQLRRLEEVLAAARARADRARRAARDLVPPPLEALEAAVSLAQRALEEAIRREEAARHRLERIDTWLEALARVRGELAAFDRDYARIGRIADLAQGKNARRATFEQFVLGTLLDDVLLAASTRLSLMTQGRYRLERVLTATDARSSAGLDLSVYDQHTGMPRPAQTLSGGEGFLASLALALGLADVVQAYAGGIRMETIFVDEGFGSLDPEALDLAFRALVDLQRGGRLVGIISHVPELKERIDVRLEVVRGPVGSTARFEVP